MDLSKRLCKNSSLRLEMMLMRAGRVNRNSKVARHFKQHNELKDAKKCFVELRGTAD